MQNAYSSVGYRRVAILKFLAGVATLVVVYLSLKPPGPDEQPWNLFFIRGDLVLHFTCYFGLSILYVFAFFKHRATYRKGTCFLAVLV
jgi:VanZ family protein